MIVLGLLLASILDEHSHVCNLDLSINVSMDIVIYNILRIANICTCLKVLVLVFVYKQFF